MDFAQRLDVEIKRLNVVKEFLMGGAQVLEFPGDGFQGFCLDATTSNMLWHAHCDNKQYDFETFFKKKGLGVGKKIEFELRRHPLTEKSGVLVGVLKKVYGAYSSAFGYVVVFRVIYKVDRSYVDVDFHDIVDAKVVV